MKREFDVVIVGSGIAGLSFALKVAEQNYKVAIVTKKNRADSNSNYAQGGIAAVTSETDDFETHVTDTLIAGDGLCDEAVVREIIADGPERIKDLEKRGVDFCRLDDGRPSLGKEGGHTKRRVLHVRDATGKAIEEALLHSISENENISVFEHFFAIDIITDKKFCKSTGKAQSDRVDGLYVLDVKSGKVETWSAQVVMLATGGVGQVYQFTTNPDIATGDGVAMASRAGVEISNMEFVQFHPTALYSLDSDERFLISEAVRGEGAILRNSNNRAFMGDYDERADLASRDIVARAIDQEMKCLGAKHLWLDVTMFSREKLLERFPTILQKCEDSGLDLTKDFIPIVPAAHFLCGGVKIDLKGQTSLTGLFACGEVGCTGLHGANRLASNSLLEAVVVSYRSAEAVIDYLKTSREEPVDLPEWTDGATSDSDERVVLSHNWDELRRTMWDYVGIVRTTKRLERARTRINNLDKEINDYYWNFKVEPSLLELRNIINVAQLIVESALERKESRGLHYTLDYGRRDVY